MLRCHAVSEVSDNDGGGDQRVRIARLETEGRHGEKE